MRADPDDRFSIDAFAPATPPPEATKTKKPKPKAPRAKTSDVETSGVKTSSVKTSSVKVRSAKTRALEQPSAPSDFTAISVEASSESLRAPRYDELWLDPRSHAAFPSPAAPARKDRSPGWAGAVAILIGVMALIALREKIVDVAPPAAKGFAAIGLPVNLAGLELREVRSHIEMDGARKVLAIEGEIANLRRESTPAPPIVLTVRGEDGQTKYAWTTRAPKSRLEPFETIAFRARLASPPETGADVLVRFASFEEAVGRKSVVSAR